MRAQAPQRDQGRPARRGGLSGARVETLLISDVPGDDPAVIASGPTVPDPTTFADARAILARYGIDPPAAVQSHLKSAETKRRSPGDPRLGRAETIIATPQMSLLAAAEVAQSGRVAPLISPTRSKANRARPLACSRASRRRRADTVSRGRALRAAFRRRDDGHDAWERGAAAATSSSCSRSRSRFAGRRDLGDRRRHRRRRRRGGDRRRDHRA